MAKIIYASRHNADGTLDETYGDGGIAYFKVDHLIYMNMPSTLFLTTMVIFLSQVTHSTTATTLLSSSVLTKTELKMWNLDKTDMLSAAMEMVSFMMFMEDAKSYQLSAVSVRVQGS